MNAGFFAICPEILGIAYNGQGWLLLKCTLFKHISNYLRSKRYDIKLTYLNMSATEANKLAHLYYAHVYLQKKKSNVSPSLPLLPARYQLFSIDPRFSIQTQIVVSFLHPNVSREDAILDIPVTGQDTILQILEANSNKMKVFYQTAAELKRKLTLGLTSVIERDLLVNEVDLVSQAESSHPELNFRHIGHMRIVCLKAGITLDPIAKNLSCIGLISVTYTS